jgi:hypothetical protein
MTIDIEPAGDRTHVAMTVDPLRDETWSQQHHAHRGNELGNLEAAIRRRAGADYQKDDPREVLSWSAVRCAHHRLRARRLAEPLYGAR